jgi:patatin-like phospholipase/acyl hydrolase
MAVKYHVLSVDGGGVRGIIPARFLKELEIRTGKEIHELFDFVVGTSTGGIIVIAAACKLNSDTILDLYLNGGPLIFPYSVLRNIKTGYGLWAPKYDREGLDCILDKHFGDRLLSETDLPICVTSYDLEAAAPKLWSSISAASNKAKDAKLKDIAAATSAAPTYFAPKKFYDMDGNIHHGVDGGIFLNNPQILALDEIIKNVPEAKREEILVVSMGTGNVELNWSVEKLEKAGDIGWVKHGRIIEAMMSSDSDFANLQASILYPNLRRLQVDLPKELSGMDNSSRNNLSNLLQKAEEYIKNNDELFTQIVQKLLAGFNMIGNTD